MCVLCLYEEDYLRPLAVEEVKTRSKQDLSWILFWFVCFSSLQCRTNQLPFSVVVDQEGGDEANSNLSPLCNCAVSSELYVTLRLNVAPHETLTASVLAEKL